MKIETDYRRVSFWDNFLASRYVIYEKKVIFYSFWHYEYARQCSCDGIWKIKKLKK